MTYQEIKEKSLAEWEKLLTSDVPIIRIGMGTCGKAAGAEEILSSCTRALEKAQKHARVIQVGCIGLCYAEPLIEIIKPGMPGIFYGFLSPERAEEIISCYLLFNNPCPDLALGTRGDEPVDGIPRLFDLPVLKHQVRISLRNCGTIDPENIDQYIAHGGYEGLSRAFAMGPQMVINEVKQSGLRGRSGGGFPTGVKWQACRKADGTVKYFICNVSEGDPDIGMHKGLLESDPHSVLEGMIIGAYAIGAKEGYIYISSGQQLGVRRMEKAVVDAKDYGLLGKNILKSGFDFTVKIKEGAGAYVCGEETALIASLEGKRGEPRLRPPFPVQAGLHEKPSTINNVETLATVSAILKNGASWFSSYGTENSKGTKSFSLAGKIVRAGLIEVPMGITLREIVYDIGGGIPSGKRFKALQTGGSAGSCLPASLLDLPVDYETLAQAGSIIGSGMIIMDEDTCMVDSAKYFLNFTMMESCGKCIPCRWGNRQLLDILNDITSGKGRPGDIDLIIELSEGIKDGSLCGLGQTSPNPVLSTIRYFRDEYEAHIKKHRCPAAVCKDLVEAPCSHTCPAGVDVPRYIRCIMNGKYDEAAAVIRESIPLASVCAYVCFHPCEQRCRRGLVDEPVAIKDLKRFALDHASMRLRYMQKPAKVTGKHIAVVGSGPAGLTAAYYLKKLCGHEVTVFEALPAAGGMLRVGIPRYRLPHGVLDAEIELIRKTGVSIRTSARVDSLDQLRKQGFDAIYLAPGAHKGLTLGIPGESAGGVMDCADFLRRLNLGEKLIPGMRVAVIGGGNAAIHASRTAMRLGATEVTILYRRTKEEMSASAEEIEEALHEGVHLECLVAPVAIKPQIDHQQMQCIRMRPGKTDASGRRQPEPIEGSQFWMEVDTIIVAISQKTEIPDRFGVAINRQGFVTADPDSLQTSVVGVFSGGDAVSGPASVIEAIAAGKQAASVIDIYLGGTGNIAEKLAPPEDKSALPEPGEEQEQHHRPAPARLPVSKRLRSFDLVDQGLTETQALCEAARCLQCDLEKYHECRTMIAAEQE